MIYTIRIVVFLLFPMLPVHTHTRFNEAINLSRYTLFLLAQRFQLNERLDLIHHLPFLLYVYRIGTSV